MSITRADVADLQPGDVVEYRRDDWPEGTVVRGPVNGDAEMRSALYVLDGFFGVRDADGNPYTDMADLTVVSRAPRPLYVNHPRTEPVPGDVINMDGIGNFLFTDRMQYAGVRPHGRETGWVSLPYCAPNTGPMLTSRTLRLLVDGETGQVVP